MPRKHAQSLTEKMHAKEWRAIPQTVALGGDTKSAKRRRIAGAFRVCSVAVLFALVAALLVFVWRDMTAELSESGAARAVELEFVTENGVLDEAWFRRWTGFDETREPNLNALRSRLLQYPQVSEARIRRSAEGKIRVELRERTPVARLVGEDGSVRLVASDGVIFPAETFSTRERREVLPILEDAKISADPKTGFERVGGIAPLAEFINLSRARYGKLFVTWDIISLKDFPTDARELSRPWAQLRVIPKPTASNPARAQIAEIIFSASRFREDLPLFAAADADGVLDSVLAEKKGAYRVFFITNRKTPGKEFREMRMKPLPAGAGTL